jgi:hypothetical protein
MATARTPAPEPDTAPTDAAEKVPTVDDLSPRERELLGLEAASSAAAAEPPAAAATGEVYLIHESGNPGSAGWYPAAVADVLLRCGEGWSRSDDPTATRTPSDVVDGGGSDQKE